jgi:methylamine dehydrogenase accessory protein MauD
MSTWTLLNTVGIVVLSAIMVLVLRQLGLILATIGPVGARELNVGPRIGENVISSLSSIGNYDSASATLLVFVSNTCPICTKLLADMGGLARHWAEQVQTIFVYDEERNTQSDKNVLITCSEGLREKLGIPVVPYGVMSDENGVVLGHGLVNTASQIESLLELYSQ